MNPHRRRRRRRLPKMAGHRIVRGHYRHNPRSGGGGGGMGIGTIALIGVGAYFVLSSGMLGSLGSMFGGAQPAIAGYTPLGGNYYRNTATGQTVYRNPSTGVMTTATGGVAPSGVPTWLQPTVQAGAMALPQLGVGLAQGVVGLLSTGLKSLFGGDSTIQTPDATVIPTTLPGGALTTTAPDVLSGAYVPTIPGDVLAAMPAPSIDWSSWLAGGVVTPTAPTPDIFAPELTGVPTLDLSLAPIDTSSWWAGGSGGYEF